MRTPDELIYPYFELATDVSNADLRQVKKQLVDPETNPRDVKKQLARTLVRMYHNPDAARNAEEEFERIFVQKELPDEIEEFVLPKGNGSQSLVGLLTATSLASSKSDARRLIEQGGVTIDGERISDINAPLPDKKEFVLKVGKRRFLKVLKH
jgi:tyrosyl-tRNA synthetase